MKTRVILILLLGPFWILLLMARPGSLQEAKTSFPWPEGKRAAISLSFDDARKSQAEVGPALFQRLGVRVTFYVNPPKLEGNLAGWKRLAASGHEIGNHTTNHPCSGNFSWARQKALEDYSLERIREDMVTADAAIEKLLGVAPASFAYPCGETFVGRGRDVRSYVPLVAELFTTGRGFRHTTPNDPAFCDFAHLSGISSDNRSFEDLKPLLDRTIEQGLWLILGGHEIGNERARQTTRVAMLEALVGYVKDSRKGIWLDTVGAIADYVIRQRTDLVRTK